MKADLIVFDTTLRDGEQSPGVTLTADEKVEIAKQLSKLGVDVCEAGFPVASEGDFKAVERIAKEVGLLMVGRKEKKKSKPMVSLHSMFVILKLEERGVQMGLGYGSDK